MSRISFHIILVSLIVGILGLTNVAALLLGMTGWISVIAALICTIIACIALFRYMAVPLADTRSRIVASCTILLLLIPCCKLLQPHAGWDGLSNWNLLAKYLSTPEGLNNIFKPGGPSHSDYPPGLPGIVAFFWLAFHTTSEWIPFLISFGYLAGLTIIITTELCSRNILYGAIVLLSLGSCAQYISQGLRHCADIPLAFYFVAALISLEAYKYNRTRSYFVFACVSIAVMPLIKNDGQLLSLCLLFFYAKLLFRKDNLVLLLLILFPVVAFLAWYKSMAPPNDLVSDFGSKGWKRITDPDRYVIIIKYLCQSLLHQFTFITLLIVCSTFIQFRKRIRISKAQVAIGCALSGYLLIYLTSSYPLDWLVGNSIDRLLVHILPAWLLAAGFAIWKPAVSKTIH